MRQPLSGLWRHRDLVWQLTKREVLGRYRGASFGLAWSIITPFMMLAIYSFAFGTVMRGRWPGADENTSFPLILFAGLIVHAFFAECLTRAPTLVTSHPNFVKRVIFPLELLPWPMVLSATFHLMMNLVVFCILRYAMDGQFTPGALWFPVVMFPLAVLCMGIVWALAALGVYLRDLGQVVGLIATATLFLSSAVTPVQIVSPNLRWVIELNPITFIIDQAREVLLWNGSPDWSGLSLYLAVSLVFAWAGWAWFQFTRKGFADVI